MGWHLHDHPSGDCKLLSSAAKKARVIRQRKRLQCLRPPSPPIAAVSSVLKPRVFADAEALLAGKSVFEDGIVEIRELPKTS